MVVIPTILCGGHGSRLWPVSRELDPKPFIALEDGTSLLQQAFLNGVGLAGPEGVLTVTNRDLLFRVQDEYRAVNPAGVATSFLLEPCARNTAAAVAAASLYVATRYGGGAVILSLAADHRITDRPAFVAAAQAAAEMAETGKIVCFGITPDHAETGYGYIEVDGVDVLRFVEKPPQTVADEYVRSGRFLWNSGMFCFTAGSMLAEMELFCPDLLGQVRHSLQEGYPGEGGGSVWIELNDALFQAVPNISVDVAVMEKSRNVGVVPCSIGWSDVGSWKALGDLTAADGEGNRVMGQALLQDVRDCYIRSSDDRLVAAVGVQNLMVIDTPDAVLIADEERVQDVKTLFSRLKADNHEAHRQHRTVFRPWGTFTVLEEGAGFKIKRLVVRPGGRLSLQKHMHRSEHWVVVSGVARVTNGDRNFLVHANESTYIAAGCQHRLENPGLIDLVMIEVQSGQYLGEDDIVRLDDAYGRQ